MTRRAAGRAAGSRGAGRTTGTGPARAARSRDLILAGDVGGTSTRLAFFAAKGDRPAAKAERTYPSPRYASLNEIVRDFVRETGMTAGAACFGIAGPVRRGRVETPNLAWIVESETLARDLGLSEVRLVNDLLASAHGVAALGPEDFALLQEGARDAAGNRAIVAPGTGLGEAGFYWDGVSHHPFASEGGHADFAPRDSLEGELLAHLRPRYGRVSVERVVSGPGLYNLYAFLRDTGRGEEHPGIAEEIRRDDPPAVIGRAALDGRCSLCAKALDLFVSLLGAEAGNLALKFLATGGVFVGGGIPPKILPRLAGKGFIEAFRDKGRMRPLLEAIPVRVILNDRTALLGAARCAVRQGS